MSSQGLSMLLSASLLSVLLAGVGCQDSATAPTGEFQKEADPPLNCPVASRARKGDKVIMEYVGFLADQTQFDSGKSEFVLGESKVISGLEKGMEGQCAGEKIVMVVPPEYGYGDKSADKIPAGSTLYFISRLHAIIRTTKEPKGGDCNEATKARPDIDVTLDIEGRVITPSGRGQVFLDKPSLEIRFGKPNAIRFVRGLESSLTGACPEEERTLFLGPDLAYGSSGKSDGRVKGGESVKVDVRIVRVRDKKPTDSKIALNFLETIANGGLKNFSG